MFKKITLIAALSFFATTVSASTNTNSIRFADDANLNGNMVSLDIGGNYNRLAISQTLVTGGFGNKFSAKISGNRNGTYVGAKFTGAAAKSGLTAGSILQSGSNNNIGLKVKTDRNLFAFVQSGSNNRIVASINGYNNQMTIRQYGQSNFASSTQFGNGNIVNITQRSW